MSTDIHTCAFTGAFISDLTSEDTAKPHVLVVIFPSVSLLVFRNDVYTSVEILEDPVLVFTSLEGLVFL